MFHKFKNWLCPPPPPPRPGSPEFVHLQRMLERRHVIDAAGCLRRAFAHGWRFHQVRSCLDHYSQLRAVFGDVSWITPGALYNHLNLAPAGQCLTDEPFRTDTSLLGRDYGIARGLGPEAPA